VAYALSDEMKIIDLGMTLKVCNPANNPADRGKHVTWLTEVMNSVDSKLISTLSVFGCDYDRTQTR